MSNNNITEFSTVRKARRDLLIISIISVITFSLSSYFDFFERFTLWSRAYERWEVDDMFMMAIIFTFGLCFYSNRRWYELIAKEKALKEKNCEFAAAIEEIKTLEGILPTCSYCKRIRDDEDKWHQMEWYIRSNSNAEFSHGICEDCEKEHFQKHYKP